MTSEGIAEAAVEKKQSPGNYNSSVSLAALSDTKSDIPSCPKTMCGQEIKIEVHIAFFYK